MQISELKRTVDERLVDFAWSEWSQLGVLGSSSRESPWAADPEALLLLALDLRRAEPRLLDETLDWLTVNGALISQQRLRNLCGDSDERAVADAALAWVGRHQKGLRSAARSTTADLGLIDAPDEPTGKSRPVRLERPIAFAFRLRKLLGVGTRAEVIRYLLTSRTPGAQAEVIRRAAGFAKRNVLDVANDLVDAGAVEAQIQGGRNERLYRVNVERWQRFLDADPVPVHRDWPQLFRALGTIRRWLETPEHERLSPYLRASEARQLMNRVKPDLLHAGVRVSNAGTGADYWSTFVENVDRALAALHPSWR